MRKFFRYDVALSVALAAAVFFMLFQVSALGAWVAAAPLVPLLRQLARQTEPALWLPLSLLVLLAGAGYVVCVEAVAHLQAALGLMPIAFALSAFGAVCYVVNEQPRPASRRHHGRP